MPGSRKKQRTSKLGSRSAGDDDDGGEEKVKFNHGLFDACCSGTGCSTCLFVCCCPACAYQEVLRDIGIPKVCGYQCGVYACLLSPICWWCLLGCFRRKVRAKRDISGFILVDCCKACFCPCCILTQMVRQVRDDGAVKSETGESEEDDDDSEEDDDDDSDESS